MDVNEHERISIITLNVFRTFFINNLKDKTDIQLNLHELKVLSTLNEFIYYSEEEEDRLLE